MISCQFKKYYCYGMLYVLVECVAMTAEVAEDAGGSPVGGS